MNFGFARLVLSAVAKPFGLMLMLAAMATPAMAFDISPEIDAGSLSSAIAMLAGGSFLLTDRIRRR